MFHISDTYIFKTETPVKIATITFFVFLMIMCTLFRTLSVVCPLYGILYHKIKILLWEQSKSNDVIICTLL